MRRGVYRLLVIPLFAALPSLAANRTYGSRKRRAIKGNGQQGPFGRRPHQDRLKEVHILRERRQRADQAEPRQTGGSSKSRILAQAPAQQPAPARLRRGPYRFAKAGRTGPALEHAVADGCGCKGQRPGRVTSERKRLTQEAPYCILRSRLEISAGKGKMPIYKGILQKAAFIKTSNTGIKVISTSSSSTVVEFPTDVRLAYVQATNRFLDDRMTFGPLTVWSIRSNPKQLIFENAGNGNGGWLCFEIDTTSGVALKASKKTAPKKAGLKKAPLKKTSK